MTISYKKLWKRLIDMDESKVSLRKKVDLSTLTMTKLRRNEPVSLTVLMRICEFCNCNIGDIMDFLQDDNENEKKNTNFE